MPSVLDERRTALLNDLAYCVALPALLFVSTFVFASLNAFATTLSSVATPFALITLGG
ncbi:hypothetical protein HTG_03120 [Natrinema mahii]|nr:hypothetical protein HTG_03120 [Natrinema mahii]